jgi:glutathione S-transferase
VFCSASDRGQLEYGRDQLALGLAALQRIGVGRWAWAAGPEIGIADTVLIPLLALIEMIERDFDGGTLLRPYPAIADYWHRAQVSEIGARTVAEMGALVPMVMARRAQA